ncbi:MAG TPA: hypothetical protein VNA19_11555 [Pyrinomonadaceae bacterium]|nr:hypothetical protein [Pyrinomonadaceae bacterium]
MIRRKLPSYQSSIFYRDEFKQQIMDKSEAFLPSIVYRLSSVPTSIV